ncbi:hypothetical protein [Meiothermus hypogaeus]|uniref:Uncharacterized protein n=2 Tax=Meiothermus hypogaeus TaxID=884155 RepID=A0A511R4U8_9DEIN|nr:hypothetical protein [Meiothermus hypogaeus]RIH80574.1 hypothetical protein Mhypo_00492 [Meiothermus hypogaeus]GEM84036.1 hypothetical protein MHY01S_22020 [Meiothermus hypogaeus NBRC 106114]GIW36151.1 MAG: hypothetical protein KatS3mg073_0296 [Meiothermus sp.]
MNDTEQKIIEALSRVISPVAAHNLLKRALRGQSPDLLGPRSWAELLEGPLQRELTGVLPVSGLIPDLQKLVRQLKAQTASVEVVRNSTRPTLETTDLTEYVDLEREQDRQALVLDLARGEGVLAVVLDSVHGQECRLGVHNDSLVALLSTVHRLLDRKGSYKVFYTVFAEAQLVLRPLDRGYLAVLTRKDTNLGQLLYRMSKIEAIQVGER